jgi:hypothetical protein
MFESFLALIRKMNKTIATCVILCSTTVVLVASIMRPELLSDRNDFLHNFVNHELLALLGIIMTITLASAAALHLEFNKIEESYKHRGLTKTRTNVHRGAYLLIILFLFSVALVVAKPLLPSTSEWQSIVNGVAIVVVIVNALVLLDLTQLTFAIEPKLDD